MILVMCEIEVIHLSGFLLFNDIWKKPLKLRFLMQELHTAAQNQQN